MKKVLSAILAACLLCTFISSCGKKDTNGETPASGESKEAVDSIPSDSLWYDSERISLNVFPDKKEVEIFSSVLDYHNDKISVVCQYYALPTEEDFLDPNFDESTCYGMALCVFDMSGNLLSKTELNKFVADNVDPSVHVKTCGFSDGKLCVLSESSREPVTVILSIIDLNNCSVLENIRYTSSAAEALYMTFAKEVFPVTEDVFMLCDDSQGRITIFDKEGNYRADTISGLFNREIHFMDTKSDKNGTVVFSCTNSQNDSVQFTLGARTITYEIKNYDLGGTYAPDFADDGNYYSVNYDGIAEFNEETSSFEMKIPVDSFNIDLSEFNKMSVLSFSDNEIVLANTRESFTGIVAYRLKKAQINPNAQKAKLTIGLFGDYTISNELGKAIFEFNDKNENNYASVRMYSYKQNHFTDADSEEKAAREAANSLMMDIQNGNGPDVIVNAFDVMELCDEKYLADLNELMKADSEYNPEEYVKQVIDLAQNDGKLYQMPLRFATLGLVATSDCAPANGTGYSFDEYKKVVSRANNGADSLAYQMDRSAYYSLLFTAMQSDLYKDRKWTLNCPEYEALALYCKDNVPEKCLANWNDDHFMLPEDLKVSNQQIDGIAGYITSVYSRGNNMYGYPSSNGNHGVMIKVNASAAISSQSENKEGAWQFVKTMMSYDVQVPNILTYDSPVNLKALKELGTNKIAEYNSMVQRNKNMSQREIEKAKQMGDFIATAEIDAAAIDAYLNLLAKATGVYRVDREILIITKEEIPAYYAGQKDFNSVITIAQDRVQKVMAERG